MRFAPDLYLVDLDDIIEVTSELTGIRFDIVLKLLPGKIIVDDHKKVKTIAINNESLILVTINQMGYKGPNTNGEIYIKNRDELTSLVNIRFIEPITDLRKTGTYTLLECLAKRIAENIS